MKTLFCKKGKYASLVDKENLIFEIDKVYFNQYGEQVPEKKEYIRNYHDDEAWEAQRIENFYSENPGLSEYLKSESITDIEYEIDDCFGCFGFKNKAGEFIIEPQYAYAYDFTNGFACVNLNRTWYKTEKREMYYENHYGYIDVNGKTAIGFNFDEAWPFNKYGVAVVQNVGEDTYLIDMEGKEIPGTRFKYLSHYYDYGHRFLEFGYDYDALDDGPLGIYDTKERKILFEPKFIDVFIDEDEECIEVCEMFSPQGDNSVRQYFINSKGERIFNWLYGKGFDIIRTPDINGVSEVGVKLCSEGTGEYNPDIKHYDFGLYSSKEKFVMPLEYDDIRRLSDSIWACRKGEVLTVIETEPDD